MIICKANKTLEHSMNGMLLSLTNYENFDPKLANPIVRESKASLIPTTFEQVMVVNEIKRTIVE